jgi:hypothetical protein
MDTHLNGNCPICFGSFNISQFTPIFKYWLPNQRIGFVVAACPGCTVKFNQSSDHEASQLVNLIAERIQESCDMGGIAYTTVPAPIYELFGEYFARAYSNWTFELPADVLSRINSGELFYCFQPVPERLPAWIEQAISEYKMEYQIIPGVDPVTGHPVIWITIKKVAM